jgi:hypothetical protein
MAVIVKNLDTPDIDVEQGE